MLRTPNKEGSFVTKIRPVGLKRAFAMSFNDCVHVSYGYKRTIVDVDSDVEIIRISKKKKKQSNLNGFVRGIPGAKKVQLAKKRARKKLEFFPLVSSLLMILGCKRSLQV